LLIVIPENEIVGLYYNNTNMMNRKKALDKI